MIRVFILGPKLGLLKPISLNPQDNKNSKSQSGNKNSMFPLSALTKRSVLTEVSHKTLQNFMLPRQVTFK